MLYRDPHSVFSVALIRVSGLPVYPRRYVLWTFKNTIKQSVILPGNIFDLLPLTHCIYLHISTHPLRPYPAFYVNAHHICVSVAWNLPPHLCGIFVGFQFCGLDAEMAMKVHHPNPNDICLQLTYSIGAYIFFVLLCFSV